MKLIDKVILFRKLAKGLSVPPRMLSRIVDFAIGTFAYRLFQYFEEALLNDKIKPKEIEYIKNALVSYRHRTTGIKVNHSWDRDRTFIRMDFDGWNTPIADIDTIYEVLTKKKILGISCELVYKGSEQGFLAEWNPRNLTLTLFTLLPRLETTEDFIKAINKLDSFEFFIKQSVEHELIHMTQNIGFELKQTNDMYGMPKRKVRNKLFDPTGTPKQQDPEKAVMAPHAFRDIEFYTNLNDSITLYKYFAGKLPVELRKTFLKIFTATATSAEINEFLEKHKTIPKIIGRNGYWWFKDLKNDEPRWREAIMKFVEAVL